MAGYNTQIVFLLFCLFCYLLLQYISSLVKSSFTPMSFLVSKSSALSWSIHKEKLLQEERIGIEEEMRNFPFESIGKTGLKDLVLEVGGSPIRAWIATSWRSGSTFLGDILVSHPATYYHYEPLLDFGIQQIRDFESETSQKSLRVLKSLFLCNYTTLDDYISYGKTHNWLLSHNNRLWKNCEQGQNEYCWNKDYLSAMCSLYPFQSMKTVRLRVNLTRHLLEDPNLNVKVLYLVRDPRGILQSRKHRSWCPHNPDCDDAKLLCQDLVSDYRAAESLLQLYPNRFKVFRYEDFSIEPYSNSEAVLKFFGLLLHPAIIEFLNSHTKTNIGGVVSTFRDSKTAPFQWRRNLTIHEVLSIQRDCHEALELWGYKEAYSQNELNNLEPLLSYKL